MDFSLIAPCYNEEKSIEVFFSAATACLEESGYTCEILFVDDGSKDETLSILKNLKIAYESGTASNHQKVSHKIISFSRNFGKEAAILAGLNHSTGDYLGIIDSDMQQNPMTALAMLSYLMEHPDYDCVAAVQENRKDAPVVAALKRVFYKLFNIVSEIDIPENASDFRVFTRQVANALASVPEYYRFSKGLFSWIGFKTHCITYQPNQRFAGESTWSTKHLFSYAFDGMLSFSTWPLKLATWLGVVVSACSALYLAITVASTVASGTSIPGYPTVVCLILLFSGIQLFTLGIIGEYLGRAYIEGKRRPIYIAKEIVDHSSSRVSHHQ